MDDVIVRNNATATIEPVFRAAQIPLSFAKMGQTVKILKVRGRGELQHHLENLGFVDGAIVKVVSESAGNLIVEIKGAQVALGKDCALKVITAV